MTIPSRIIEGIYNSELNAEKYYSTYGKENIEQALQELQKSNMEILNKYSPEDMKAAVLEKMNKKDAGTKSKKNILSFSSYKILSYAAAAVFIAAIAIPAGITSYKAKTPVISERTKGPALAAKDTNIQIYRQKGNEIHALSNGDSARAGDVLQITYQAGNSEYGVIFSVDGNGNVTRHFPENNWTASKLKHGNEEIPLDFSYELDNAPDYEFFVMVTSQNQFSMDNLESKIKNGKSLNYLETLSYLPKNTESKTFLIKK